MKSKLFNFLIFCWIFLCCTPSYAVNADNPKEHAYHSFIDDTLNGLDDKQKLDGRTRYYPDLPDIAGSVFIDEVYLRITFAGSVSPDINRISRVETCQGEQVFINPAKDFHYTTDGHSLILANNYVDGRYTNQLFDADCWVVDIDGADDVVKMEVNITYHHASGVDSDGLPILQDYYADDGYLSGLDNFTGRGTLAVIPDAVLDSEKACEPLSGAEAVPFSADNLVVLV